MQTIFFLVAAYGAILFFYSGRRFDFVSAGYMGMLIYFGPGFYGYVLYPWMPWLEPNIPIVPTVYAIWTFALAATIVTGKLYYRTGPNQFTNFSTDWATDYAIIAIIIVSFALMMITSGAAVMSSDKHEVLANINRFFILFASATQLGLVLFVLQRKWLRSLAPIAGVLFLLYLGFRNDLALGAVALLTVTANRRGLRALLRLRYTLPTAVIVLILLAYKPVLYAYRSGHTERAASMLNDPDFIVQSISRSEPFLTQAILNEIVSQNYSAGAMSMLYAIIALVPFLLPLMGVRNQEAMFSFQDALFPHLSYGVGSNIYGHFYAVMGAAGIVLFVVLHNLALVGLSSRLSRGGPFAFSITVMLGAFIAFYIHRNDLVHSATLIGRIFVIVAIIWGIAQLLRAGVSVEAPRLPSGASGERMGSRPSES